jgi:hypothetical protein
MISWREFLKVFTLRTATANKTILISDPTISLEEIRKFLPTFLSQDSEDAFLDEIKNFLRQAENRPFYSEALRDRDFIFQGDGIEDLLIINLPNTTTNPGLGMVLSNSCDINPKNERLFEASLCYTPIISLPRYLDALKRHFHATRVAEHERDIRRQAITQIFFLPKGGKLGNDAIVFLDRIISMPNQNIDRNSLPGRRIFTLGDFGAWLFTLKLSIHFCRIRDKVDRRAGVILE